MRHGGVDASEIMTISGGHAKMFTDCHVYLDVRLEEDPALAVTCIRCIAASQRRVSLLRAAEPLRGETADVTMIDEAQDLVVK